MFSELSTSGPKAPRRWRRGDDVAGDAKRDGPYASPARHAKATKHDSRRSNLRTTLELVSHRGSTSRAEISRETGLTRAAVSSLVGELMETGLLREIGQGS